jgi:hypothetical protein
MVFEQEVYVGDSELSSAGALTSAPNALIFKQDNAGGSFKGISWERNSGRGTNV